MHAFILLIACVFAVSDVFAASMKIEGVVKNDDGTSIENAVVLLKVNDGLTAYARTLSKNDGSFILEAGNTPGDMVSSDSHIEPNSSSSSGGQVSGNSSSSEYAGVGSSSSGSEISPIARHPGLLQFKFSSYQIMDLRGRSYNSPDNLPQGIYVLFGKTEAGKSVNLGLVYHKGGALRIQSSYYKQYPASNGKLLAKSITTTGEEVQLIVRKAGYLPKEVELASFNENVGAVVLTRDPLEARIDSVMELMTKEDKIAQMTQPLVGSVSYNGSLFGSVLHGGGGYNGTFLSSMANTLSTWTKAKIPVTYGKDFVHGTTEVSGSTIFPHNIGLGATRDSALVRKIGEAIAKESWAAGVDLNFAPAISVPQDERWGRVYEGFGETAELAVMMGPAMVRGMQGEKYNAPWRIIATAKHYLADGSTTNGVDRGNNATITDDELRAVHLPGYEAVVEQGVLSIMASFSQIRGVHQHVDDARLNGWLKTELGFDGYVISDWLGIATTECPGCKDAYGASVPVLSSDAVKKAINAGIDLAMEPDNHTIFINHLTSLVNSGGVSEARVNDAVRRILRAKFRAGRMDNPSGPTAYSASTGSAEHRQIAREAVRKSLVLLQNKNNALPISKSSKVYVTGSHATNTGYQCGGWTVQWQGTSSNIAGATSIQAGIDAVVPGAMVTTASQADVIIYVTGETPYAEWEGDITDITFSDNLSYPTLSTLISQNPGKKIVTVFISGRPRETNSLLNASDAFVAAWLPGSEGAGVADVLFKNCDDCIFTGKLPHTWPRNKAVFPKNSTEESNDWFPYGFGLRYP